MEKKKRKWGKQRRWWQAVLCALLLAGCSQKNLEAEISSAAEIDSQAEIGSDDIYENISVKQEMGIEDETEELTGLPVLKELLKCDRFALCVLEDADIQEEDTEETILQKMEQCEYLILEGYNGGEKFDLEGLRFFPNLKRLKIDFDSRDIWYSEVEGFAPIAELSQLKELYLSYYTGEEIDLSFLGGMESITELYLPYCQIADITFLGEMPQLERLSLYYTYVEDLSVLEKLPKLAELALGGNSEAKHIEVVGKLTKMEDLGLQDCGIEDIGFLSDLTELRGVNLNGNSIADLTPLAGLSKLERLGAANNQISDICPISGLSNLFDLALDQNQIRDISALAGLSHLNQVGLSDNQIEDFSPLEGKEELMELSVFGNPCKDFRAIWMVPFFNYETDFKLSEEQQAVVDSWMTVYRPDIEEYECIDYTEGDLNEDGLLDAVFVVDGFFDEGDGYTAYDNTRRLFILLRQKDGSWRESEERIRVLDGYAGGRWGDPHHSILIGNGYLIVKHAILERTITDVYRYQDEKLELIFGKGVGVSENKGEIDVGIAIYNNDVNTGYRYTIVMDGYRMVRVD